MSRILRALLTLLLVLPTAGCGLFGIDSSTDYDTCEDGPCALEPGADAPDPDAPAKN